MTADAHVTRLRRTIGLVALSTLAGLGLHACLIEKGTVVGPQQEGAPNPPGSPVFELSITKTVNRASAFEGDTLVYTLQVANAGPDAAPDVLAGDSLPAGVRLITATTGVGTFNADRSWTIGQLAPNGTATLTLVTVLDSAPTATVVNIAGVMSTTLADAFTGNNVDSVSTTIESDFPLPDVVFQDGFETGNLSTAVGGYFWGAPRGFDGELPTVSTDIARTGNYSLKFTFLGNLVLADDDWSEQRFVLGDSLTEITLQWYQYFPTGLDGLGARFVHRNADGPDNNKFLRLWDIDYNDYRLKLGFSTQLRGGDLDPKLITEYGVNVTGVGARGSREWNPAITDAFRGRWVRFLVHVKLATSANDDGVIEMWADGQKVIENLGLAMYPQGGLGNFLKNGYLMGWSNTGFDLTTYTYIDDFSISRGFVIPP